MPKPINNLQQLSSVSGIDESSLEQLSPAVQQVLFDKPYLAKGFIDKTYTLADGKVNVNDSYKTSPLYQRLANLKPGTVIDNDTLQQMFESISTYSYLNHGKAPKVTFMPKIVVGGGPGQVTNEALLLFMDKMVTGLANGDLPRINMDLEATMDTGLGRIVEREMDRNTFYAMTKYIPFLSQPSIGDTTKNWVLAINKVAQNNSTEGPEMTFDAKGNVISATQVKERDLSKPASISDQEFSTIVDNLKKKKANGVDAAQAAQDALFDDNGKALLGGKPFTNPDGSVSTEFKPGLSAAVPLAMFNAGYGSSMVRVPNANGDASDIAYRNEVDADIAGDNIVAKPINGSGQFVIPTQSASKTFLDRIKLGNAFVGSPGFKKVGKKIAGKNYIIGSMSGEVGASSLDYGIVDSDVHAAAELQTGAAVK